MEGLQLHAVEEKVQTLDLTSDLDLIVVDDLFI
jgi:hypothetical protein